MRTLDCAQCFQAQGRMCYDRNNAQMFNVTGSTNPAHGVCCSSQNTNGICSSMGNDDGQQYICSPPSYQDPSVNNTYTPILTNNSYNM